MHCVFTKPCVTQRQIDNSCEACKTFPQGSNFVLYFPSPEMFNCIISLKAQMGCSTPEQTNAGKTKSHCWNAPCCQINSQRGVCWGGCCVIFHLGRTCLLLAWFLMLGSFPLGMFKAILLRLNLRVADSKRSPGHLWGVYAFSWIPCYLPFTVGVISIYTQSKINKDDTQHSAASHFLPCQRWTLSPWQTWLFKFMLLLLVLFSLQSKEWE